MSKTQFQAAVLFAAFPCIAAASAADGRIADPVRAVLSPQGAVLYVEETLPVEREDGVPTVRMLLPANATDLQIVPGDAPLARITRRIVTGAAQGELSAERVRLEAERVRLNGQVTLWKAQIENAEDKDPLKVDIPALYVSIEKAKRSIAEIDELLKSYPKNQTTRLLVKAALADEGARSVKVRYSYRISDSRWQPAYNIDCVPGKDGMGRIAVRLEAIVQQNTCFDWKNTEVSLVSKGAGPVRPGSVRSWNVGYERQIERVRARGDANMMAAAVMDEAPARMMMKSTGSRAPVVVANTQGGYAAWTPSMKGLVQGESRILLASGLWNEPLVWTVRPLNRDAQVYICAEHKLDGAMVWPEAQATLSVEGVAVGQDRFSPREGKVFLAFGNDPRVRLTAKTEPRKSGTEGFIGKTRIWDWAWSYTVRNDRDQAVNVSVERPRPKSVHKDVTVEYSGTPSPVLEDNVLKWKLQVAPHSESVVKHAVKVTAPEKLEIVTPVSP